MTKLIKTCTVIFALFTAIQPAPMLSMKNNTFNRSLSLLFTLKKYAIKSALFDIINYQPWSEAKKLKKLKKLFNTFKINVNMHDENKLTPLHYAIKLGYLTIVELLVAHGADVNETYYLKTYTPTQWAVINGQIDIAKFLIKNSTLLKQLGTEEDANGNTPLHIAAFYGNKKTIKQLIQDGINPLIKNKSGLTAQDVTEIGYKNPELIRSLHNKDDVSEEESLKNISECRAYLNLVTDFYTALHIMTEISAINRSNKEELITRAFTSFAHIYLTGKNADQNIMDIHTILHLDTTQHFSEQFYKSYKKNMAPEYVYPKSLYTKDYLQSSLWSK